MAYCLSCQDEFSPVEYSDDMFCSYDCYDRYADAEDNLAAYESARYSGASPLN